jgi:hypothetical protein|tara:strand:+ start:1347 stop:1928 length:582 start_codon:yes stop_codon:yes gene_type:complete
MQLDAPIPGGNYTTDTRNYSWHRPPDLVDYDDAIGYLIEKIDEPEQIELVYAMLGIDAHITTVVTTILLQAISKGKIGIDLAILIAGPLARYIEISAKDVGIKYEMGVEDKDRVIITPTLLKASLGIIDPEDEEEAVVEQEVVSEEPTGGLMAMPTDMAASSDEQAEMLGAMNPEDEALGDEAAVEEELINEL